jgi:phage terminase large subunit-like protein
MDAIQVGELQGQLRRLTGAHLSYERMMGHLIEERDRAWHREDEARACTNELEFYVEDIEEYDNNLHESFM